MRHAILIPRICFFMICCFACVDAAATTIQLTQGGWQLAGPLTVSFTGEDSNADGQIDLSELTSFDAAYRLPQGGTTTWAITDVFPDGFLYSSIEQYLFFAGNSGYILVDSAFPGVVIAAVIDTHLFPVDTTETAPVIVPEISTLALAVSGIIAFLISRRCLRTCPP